LKWRAPPDPLPIPSLAKTLTLSVPAGFWVNNLVRFGPRNEPSANFCLDYGAELEG